MTNVIESRKIPSDLGSDTILTFVKYFSSLSVGSAHRRGLLECQRKEGLDDLDITIKISHITKTLVIH